MTPQHDRELAMRIANAVGRTERKYLRIEGADWIDTYVRSWQIEDDTYNFILDFLERKRR